MQVLSTRSILRRVSIYSYEYVEELRDHFLVNLLKYSIVILGFFVLFSLGTTLSD